MRVALLGLGLIGGSLGLALRAERPEIEVVGWDPDPAALALARERGAIAREAADPAAAVADADRVVLAAPVGAFPALFAAIAPCLRPEAVVTDVASTKAAVTAWASNAGLNFVGGHPMAGSEQVGVAHARADLFRGAAWCVTPPPSADPAAVAAVEALATSVGARPLRLDPSTHDAFVAAVSHLPFATSAALVSLTTADPRWAQMAPLAATGYRDATRLASGSPAMYRDICLTNQEAIAPLLRHLAATLTTLADQLDDPQAVEAFFTRARDARDTWLAARDHLRMPHPSR
ncbi:prephenate dehydrogenase/arogenate dehydrogenase family protein [bacterium]|nr:prephenate dehydrogenase/arogenate dehydrogenase family protein [bacterium]